MKTVLALRKTRLRRLLEIVLVANLLASCAAIPAGKVKLENYPEVNKIEGKELLLNHKTFKFYPDKKGYSFDSLILSKLNESIKSTSKSSCAANISTMHFAPLPRLCIANYFAAGITLFTIPYYCQHIYQANAYLLSYPSQNSIKGKAININPNQIDLSQDQIQVVQSKESSTNFLAQKNKIWQKSGQQSGQAQQEKQLGQEKQADKRGEQVEQLQQSRQSQNAIQVGQLQQQSEEFQQVQQAKKSEQNQQNQQSVQSHQIRQFQHNYLLTQNNQKIYEGDYFLNEKGELVHLLKTYKLEDKVHEVWSLLMILGELALAPTGVLANSTISTPEAAKAKTESTISESLTRSILNDAISFEECRKN